MPVGFDKTGPSYYYGDDFRWYLMENAKAMHYDDGSLRVPDIHSPEVAQLSDVELLKRIYPVLTKHEIGALRKRVRSWSLLRNRYEIELVLMRGVGQDPRSDGA